MEPDSIRTNWSLDYLQNKHFPLKLNRLCIDQQSIRLLKWLGWLNSGLVIYCPQKDLVDYSSVTEKPNLGHQRKRTMQMGEGPLNNFTVKGVILGAKTPTRVNSYYPRLLITFLLSVYGWWGKSMRERKGSMIWMFNELYSEQYTLNSNLYSWWVACSIFHYAQWFHNFRST